MRKSDKEYLQYCVELARNNSHDPSTKTAAIIVDYSGNIAAVGYNRFPKDVTMAQIAREPNFPAKQKVAAKEITWERDGDYVDTKYPYVVHAEVACCLDWLKKHSLYVPSDDDIMYMTLAPCDKCAQMIIETGIKHIVFADDKYHDKDFSIAARRLLDAAGVSYKHIPLD